MELINRPNNLMFMRTNYLMTSLMMVSLCFSSCSKENDIINDTEKMVEMSFSGSIEGLENEVSNSRTIIDYTGEYVGDDKKWPNTISFDTDEDICVFPKKSTPTGYKFSNSLTNRDIFSGMMYEQDADNNDGYIVVYPYNEQNSIDYTDADNFTIKIHIPTEQKMNNDDNIDNNPSYAFLDKNTSSFQLGCAASLLRIYFTGNQEKLSKITKLKLTTQYSIAGTLSVPYKSGVLQTITSTDYSVTILPPDGGFILNQGYYVVVRGTSQPTATLTATLTNGNTVELCKFDSARPLTIKNPKIVTPINITL